MVAGDLVSLFLSAEVDALALLVVTQENALSLRVLEEMAPSKVYLLEELAQNRPGLLSAEGVIFLVFSPRVRQMRDGLRSLSLLCNVTSNPWALSGLYGWQFFSTGTHAVHRLFIYLMLLTVEATRRLIFHR